MSITLTHHRFSVEDYGQMIESGILGENDRVELIRGEILEKMSIGDEHLALVNRWNRLFVQCFDDRAIVSIQNPVRLNDSEPEPDIALLVPREDYYASGKPRATDVLLLIEVADTSLDFDRNVKRALYAENGVGEYWIVNLIDHVLEVYRQPQPDGRYAETQALQIGDSIEISTLPGQFFAIADLL